MWMRTTLLILIRISKTTLSTSMCSRLTKDLQWSQANLWEIRSIMSSFRNAEGGTQFRSKIQIFLWGTVHLYRINYQIYWSRQEITYSSLNLINLVKTLIHMNNNKKRSKIIAKAIYHRISIGNLWTVTTFIRKVSSMKASMMRGSKFGRSMRLLIKTSRYSETITTTIR